MIEAQRGQTIVFFDGVCHLCNQFVDFAVRQDSRKILRFAPLQGKTAAQLVRASDRENLSSVLVAKDGKILTKSTAVLHVLVSLGGLWAVGGRLGLLIPSWGRDLIYDWVAKLRYQWFGRRETCRLPTAEEKSFLLD